MKIRISDTNCGKFSKQLEEHWQSQGHDVKRSMYYEHEFLDADMYFFDSADNTVIHFSTEKKKRPPIVIVRSLDIDIWHQYYLKWDFDWIDHWIFINDTMRDWSFKEESFKKPEKTKVHTINCGVDMNKFSLRKNKKRNKKIAWIGRFWIAKNVAGAIKIVKELNRRDPGWSLHLLGTRFDPGWWKAYCENLISEQNFPITIDEHAVSVSEWLEDKDYFLLTSFKEAFSYVTAEAMSKGLKPVINNFWGCKELWPKEYIYDTHGEAADIILNGEYDPNKYRRFIKDNYNQDIMFKKIDALFQ